MMGDCWHECVSEVADSADMGETEAQSPGLLRKGFLLLAFFKNYFSKN